MEEERAYLACILYLSIRIHGRKFSESKANDVTENSALRGQELLCCMSIPGMIFAS